jgi:hypothetical protein
MANALREIAPRSLAPEIVEIRDLALYDEDLFADWIARLAPR